MVFLYIQWYRISGKQICRSKAQKQREALGADESLGGENGNPKEDTRSQARTSVKGRKDDSIV